MPPPRSDVELLAASEDDPEAFGEIVTRHQTAIFRFAARRAGRRDAADLTAEIFARAFASRRKFDHRRTSALPWLYGIASHVVVDHLRRADVRSRINVSAWPDDLDPFDRVLDAVAAEAARSRIVEALSQLTPQDRETLLIVVLGDLTGSEAAEALGVPVGTIKSRIARAKSQMRSLLGSDLSVEKQ